MDNAKEHEGIFGPPGLRPGANGRINAALSRLRLAEQELRRAAIHVRNIGDSLQLDAIEDKFDNFVYPVLTDIRDAIAHLDLDEIFDEG